MDLEFSKEQLKLQKSAAGMLERRAPLALARSFHEGGADASELWDQIAQLGWLGVGLEPDDPFGVPGLCLLAEALGRRAAPHTLIDTAMVSRVAAALDSAWVEPLIDGDPTLSLAFLETGGTWLGNRWTTSLVRHGDRVIINGQKTGVHHAAGVRCLAVVGELDDLPAIAFVPTDAAGLSVTPLHALDPTCAAGRVGLQDVEIGVADVLAGSEAQAALAHALDVSATAVTAEGLGAAGAALEMAVAYSQEREQYGRPIAGFQALRHLLAEAHQQRETAWASVLYAAAALEDRTEDAHAATLVAKAHGAAATKVVVEAALQAFGGIGVTFASDLHLVYRRALECAARFGGVDEYEQRVADTLLSPEPAFVGR